MQEGWSWRCTSFDAPGLPPEYLQLAAEGLQGGGASDAACGLARAGRPADITHYLSNPNPINMLHQHGPGRIVHLRVPLPTTVSHMARCLTADASRVWLLWHAAAGAAGLYQVRGNHETSLRSVGQSYRACLC